MKSTSGQCISYKIYRHLWAGGVLPTVFMWSDINLSDSDRRKVFTNASPMWQGELSYVIQTLATGSEFSQTVLERRSSRDLSFNLS